MNEVLIALSTLIGMIAHVVGREDGIYV